MVHALYKSCLYSYISAHWFSSGDYSVELHNVGMLKLAHDDCLLEKFDLVFFRCQTLQSHKNCLVRGILPNAFLHISKMARPNMFGYPEEA